MITVHLRINDAATGKPTPVRLRITGPNDTYFAPFGRLTEFATGRNEDVGGNLCVGRDQYAYIDGACEIRLPTGVPLRVRASKGPEYAALDETVVLGPGQMALRFAVARISDVRATGWHPGDTRVHFLSPHAAALEAAAEDVAVVNLLATVQTVSWLDGHAFPSVPNITAFSGQRPALQTDTASVVVNTLNTHPVLGQVGLLNCHRTVYPLSFGGSEDTDDWSVTDWCQQCHRKKGLAVWVSPFGTDCSEALIALILGNIDAIEYDAHPRKRPLLPWYYHLLNAGIVTPLVGGSGKDSNMIPVGAVRTYARLPLDVPPSYGAWIEAVRSGHCFATNGPLLTFEVNGHGPGETVDVPASESVVSVKATATSGTAFEKLDLIADGKVIATAMATQEGTGWSATLDCDHKVEESGWLAARCSGSAGAALFPSLPAFAHTSPVTVRVAGNPLPRRQDAVNPLTRAVERTREWIEQHGRFADEKWKRQLLARCDEALVRLKEPPAR
ncbi:CehA/McbA family metallohydrolase [Fimbriiglobus ruber]|uniref:Uncharacterized protein n=1 Tax=Fimbriiglobus ruber TaxID=1908690 RepID=A0A225D5Z1_9BACT|nr:CehA/McbA family metallohydrolase [Fimbriiglobus ruber]OWK35054.1 hypothetical protein FRUB_09896 [Fimbriiglobus ruber]